MKDATAFNRNVGDLVRAIDLCLRSELLLPGVALLYSLIDLMAWLSRPGGQDDVHRADFVRWVDKYLLPIPDSSYGAIDLYAARCSIIHSYTAESKLSREGDASRVCYTMGDRDPKRLQSDLDSVGYAAIVVHVDSLFKAVLKSIDIFKDDLNSNEKLAAIVFGRSETKFYSYLPPS
jgi:hypothetical protein